MFDNREKLDFFTFLALGATILTLAKTLTEVVSQSFLTSLQTFFSFFSTTNRSRDSRGVFEHPLPVGGGKSGVPVGLGLKS